MAFGSHWVGDAEIERGNDGGLVEVRDFFFVCVCVIPLFGWHLVGVGDIELL